MRAYLDVEAVGHIGLTGNATTSSRSEGYGRRNFQLSVQAGVLKVRQTSVCGRAFSQRAVLPGSSTGSGTAARQATLRQTLRLDQTGVTTPTGLILSLRRLSAQDYTEVDLRPISMLQIPVDGSPRLPGVSVGPPTPWST